MSPEPGPIQTVEELRELLNTIRGDSWVFIMRGELLLQDAESGKNSIIELERR